ncbi:hypothetical protein K474DRAFT_1655250 [Panus rudis PR-1116 ss-1]|nr:hypothetical protein K474DRAFT_1655250 [Panus rudis PR-1116 ss-1]
MSSPPNNNDAEMTRLLQVPAPIRVDTTVLPEAAVNASPSVQSLPHDLLLVVFIHGFKGTDDTFGEFPERLRHILAETIPHVTVESVVFPAYETKGELTAAVIRFADWLTNLTVEREVANGVGGGAGKAKIVLCGHSMGGLLAADALIEFVRTRPDPKAPLWPNIIGCIAFDTPYLGLHPHVFRNSATQAAGYVKSASGFFSHFRSKSQGAIPIPKAAPAAAAPIEAGPAQRASVWKKWAPVVGGALVAGAAVGTAYYKRDELGSSYTWATDHMKYVSALWDEKALRSRVDSLLEIEKTLGVTFRDFYTYLAPSPPTYTSGRTFIIVPDASTPYASHFLPAQNGLASDEVQAHTGMFDGKTNDGYYELGLMSAQLIRDAVVTLRTMSEHIKTRPVPRSPDLDTVPEIFSPPRSHSLPEVIVNSPNNAPSAQSPPPQKINEESTPPLLQPSPNLTVETEVAQNESAGKCAEDEVHSPVPNGSTVKSPTKVPLPSSPMVTSPVATSASLKSPSPLSPRANGSSTNGTIAQVTSPTKVELPMSPVEDEDNTSPSMHDIAL